MIHEAPDLAPFHIALKFGSVDAGGEAVLRANLEARLLHDPSLVEAIVVDAEGEEIARAVFEDNDHGWHRTPLFRIKVPDTPGVYEYEGILQRILTEEEAAEMLAALEAAAEDEEVPGPEIIALHSFTIEVTGHSTQMVVWDLPGAVEAGAQVKFRVGVKCSCGCNTAGWGFTVADAEGKVLTEGAVGHEPWAGTAALYHAEVTLPAPAEEGTHLLVLHAAGPQEPVAHSPRETRVQFAATPAAQHEIRVQVFDQHTGRPVPRAKVVIHPYRALADEEGRAVIRVPAGTYTIFASGTKYFAWKEVREVTEDIDLRAELIHDRELTTEEIWA